MSQALNINLSSPSVQRFLGVNPQGRPREMVRLAGDVADPTGATGARGSLSMTSLTRDKEEVLVVFGDLVMTVDVYRLPNEPLQVHITCPRCHNHSTIRADRKDVDYDPKAANPMRRTILGMAGGNPEIASLVDFGEISVETFECSWEIGNDKHVQGGVHTGVSLCRMRMAIDRNRAREA